MPGIGVIYDLGMETDRLSLQLCQISVIMVNPLQISFSGFGRLPTH